MDKANADGLDLFIIVHCNACRGIGSYIVLGLK